MASTRRGFRLLAVFGLSLALLLTACSSDSSDDGAQSTDTTQVGDSVNRDGVVRVGFDITAGDTFSFDPTQSSGISAIDPLYYMIYGRLMRKLADGSVVPDLAESVEVVNPNTIEVKVRPDQTWHDGQPFDATSVKEGLDYALAAKSPSYNPAFFTVSSVDVVDPSTVRINFPEGNAPNWNDLFVAAPASTIVRPGLDRYSIPVGAGPMKVADFEQGRTIALERFDGYWNADEVNFARLETVQMQPEAQQSAVAALKAGQVDVVTVDTTQLPALTGDFASVVVSDPNRLMRMNACKREEMANAKYRKAISKAIDREAISAAVFAGTATEAVQLYPEGHRFFNEEVGDELGYDPEAARQLLQESGVTDPQLDIYMVNALSMPDVAAVMEQQLAAIGIDANIKIAGDFVKEFISADIPGTAGIMPPTSNAGTNRLTVVVGDTISNVCDYDNPVLNSLTDQLKSVSEGSEEAKELWWQIQDFMAREVPFTPLLFSSVLGGYDRTDMDLDGNTYPDGLWVFPDIYTASMTS